MCFQCVFNTLADHLFHEIGIMLEPRWHTFLNFLESVGILEPWIFSNGKSQFVMLWWHNCRYIFTCVSTQNLEHIPYWIILDFSWLWDPILTPFLNTFSLHFFMSFLEVIFLFAVKSRQGHLRHITGKGGTECIWDTSARYLGSLAGRSGRQKGNRWK